MSASAADHDAGAALDRRSRRVALATIGPAVVDGVHVVLRRPRLTDGPAWRRARALDADRLRAAFGDEPTLVAWAEQVLRQRAKVKAGTMVPFVLVRRDGAVLGECSFVVDRRSGSVECSMWAAEATSEALTTWTMASAMLRVLELPHPVPCITAPVAVGNPGPGRLLTLAGLERVTTARELRLYDGVPTDHVVWRLANTSDNRQRLRELVERHRGRPGA